MDDLVAFLRARLNDDERDAKSLGDGVTAVRYMTSGQPLVYAAGQGGASWLPAKDRLLREVEAKRAILKRHEDCGSCVGYCDDGGHGGPGGCPDLRELAAIYTDHPGYRAEWKP